MPPRIPTAGCSPSLISPSSISPSCSRPSLPNTSTPIITSAHTHPQHQQIRHATLIRRPHRPYTFTQVVLLSDGSTYTQRTTSPTAVLRSNKDSRNTLLWQPTLAGLQNREKDEAGRLAAFRERFGHAYEGVGLKKPGAAVGGPVKAGQTLPADLKSGGDNETAAAKVTWKPQSVSDAADANRDAAAADGEQGTDNLMDLITTDGWNDDGSDASLQQQEIRKEGRGTKYVHVMRGARIDRVLAETPGQKKKSGKGQGGGGQK